MPDRIVKAPMISSGVRSAMLAIIAVPSMLGMMLGSTVGVGLLSRANVTVLRKVVVGLLLLAGIRALLKGFGV